MDILKGEIERSMTRLRNAIDGGDWYGAMMEANFVAQKAAAAFGERRFNEGCAVMRGARDERGKDSK